MSFPAQLLQPIGGTMYSHIFENTTTGLQRDHFWSLTVDFAPFNYDGETWDCSVSVEWIRFPIRDWRTLATGHATTALADKLVEGSFYFTRHHWASVKELRIERASGNRFHVLTKLLVDFQGFTGNDANPEMEISAEADIEYSGLIIVPENLFPKPNTSRLVIDIVEAFADSTAYHPSEDEGFRFMLRPKW